MEVVGTGSKDSLALADPLVPSDSSADGLVAGGASVLTGVPTNYTLPLPSNKPISESERIPAGVKISSVRLNFLSFEKTTRIS